MTIEWLSHVHAKLGQPDHAVNSVPFHRPPPTKTAGVSRGRGAAVFRKQRGRVIDWAPCLLALVLPERPPPPGGFCCFNAGVALEGGGGARWALAARIQRTARRTCGPSLLGGTTQPATPPAAAVKGRPLSLAQRGGGVGQVVRGGAGNGSGRGGRPWRRP